MLGLRVAGSSVAVARFGGDRFALGRCPAGEQVQRLLALRTGLDGEREQHEARAGGERHALVAELEVPDEGDDGVA